MSKIFIYGVAGTDKARIARYLKAQLDYPLLDATIIKEVLMPRTATEREDPFLHISMKFAWRHFGNLTMDNVIKGLYATRHIAKKALDKELLLYENVIVEGSFIDPIYRQKGGMYLIVIRDEIRHRHTYDRSRPSNPANDEGFNASRILQTFLIREAKELGIPIIDNPGDPWAAARWVSAEYSEPLT